MTSDDLVRKAKEEAKAIGIPITTIGRDRIIDTAQKPLKLLLDEIERLKLELDKSEQQKEMIIKKEGYPAHNIVNVLRNEIEQEKNDEIEQLNKQVKSEENYLEIQKELYRKEVKKNDFLKGKIVDLNQKIAELEKENKRLKLIKIDIPVGDRAQHLAETIQNQQIEIERLNKILIEHDDKMMTAILQNQQINNNKIAELEKENHIGSEYHNRDIKRIIELENQIKILKNNTANYAKIQSERDKLEKEVYLLRNIEANKLLITSDKRIIELEKENKRLKLIKIDIPVGDRAQHLAETIQNQQIEIERLKYFEIQLNAQRLNTELKENRIAELENQIKTLKNNTMNYAKIQSERDKLEKENQSLLEQLNEETKNSGELYIKILKLKEENQKFKDIILKFTDGTWIQLDDKNMLLFKKYLTSLQKSDDKNIAPPESHSKDNNSSDCKEDKNICKICKKDFQIYGDTDLMICDDCNSIY